MNGTLDPLWHRLGIAVTASCAVMLAVVAFVAVPAYERAMYAFREEISAIALTSDLTREERQERISDAHAKRREAAHPAAQAIPLLGGLVTGLVMIRRARANCAPASTAHRVRENLARWPSTRYSTFWPRFWAGILDGFALAPLAALIQLARQSPTEVSYLSLLHTILAYVYSIWLLSARGQTAGKWLCRVCVVDATGEGPMRRWQPWARDGAPLLLTIVTTAMLAATPTHAPSYVTLATVASSILGVWFLLEVFTMLFNRRRRALHDFIAGTVVVRRAE